jgi:hypothetical protein
MRHRTRRGLPRMSRPCRLDAAAAIGRCMCRHVDLSTGRLPRNNAPGRSCLPRVGSRLTQLPRAVSCLVCCHHDDQSASKPKIRVFAMLELCRHWQCLGDLVQLNRTYQAGKKSGNVTRFTRRRSLGMILGSSFRVAIGGIAAGQFSIGSLTDTNPRAA